MSHIRRPTVTYTYRVYLTSNLVCIPYVIRPETHTFTVKYTSIQYVQNTMNNIPCIQIIEYFVQNLDNSGEIST